MKRVDENRRIWPDQILTVNRLKVGMKVNKYFKHIRSGTINTCFYADSNLTPCESGWKQTNYLIATE